VPVLGPADLGLQLDIALRLLLSAVLGATIGLEREMHAHPAGMRTHLLVSLGAAMFTVVSIYGFLEVAGPGQPGVVDPTRIAAQIVSGIGFLGAGAILKYGASIRGLTTAGSLWATAAIGMAAGAGQLVVAVGGMAIVLFSLWPLNWIVGRLRIRGDETIRLRLRLRGLAGLGAVTSELSKMQVEIAEVRTARVAEDRYDVELDVRPPAGTPAEGLIEHITSIADVELVEPVA
jgi:putative Mg2+ transporter-C (MgtC) family protein